MNNERGPEMLKSKVIVLAICVLASYCVIPLLGDSGDPDLVEVPSSHEETRASYPFLAINTDVVSDTIWKLNVEWSGYRYPYLVQRNITIREGVTLIIDPGVTVRFNPDVALSIAGTLLVNGELFKQVYFLPWKNDPNEQHSSGDWVGLRFLPGSGNSVVEHANIKYAAEAITFVANTSPIIENSTIESSFYHAIYSGEYTAPIIKNNVINVSRWAGIIADNRSKPTIDGNEIYTAMHGIVLYSNAEVLNNKIERCWLAILSWSNANITGNQINDNFDGIHAFYSDPRIENNDIRGSMGNGTRFISSNATVRYNTFRWNNVGLDITYEGRGILNYMEGNIVNGIDVQTLFYVDQQDLVIEGLNAHSGWPYGYSGYPTAQGSVTLFDCQNVTFRNCTIQNARKGIFAANSTLRIYNTTFKRVSQAQVYLEHGSFAESYNNSVDAGSVSIGENGGLFISYDILEVTVLDHELAPLEGATVVVKESQFVLHNTTTDVNGKTLPLLVKNKTVASSGVIGSPLTVQIYADGYHFDNNPKTLFVEEEHTAIFVDLGDINPPVVLSASIDTGDKTVAVNANITITFSEPMDRASTEAAFTISGNVAGTYTWIGNNLTFDPNGELAHLTYYTITIGEGATDPSGNALSTTYSFSFTTIPEPEAASWGFVAAAVISIFAVMGIAGWWMLKKMK